MDTVFKTYWFGKAAKQQLTWLRKNGGSPGLICAFQEFVKDYDRKLLEYAHAFNQEQIRKSLQEQHQSGSEGGETREASRSHRVFSEA